MVDLEARMVTEYGVIGVAVVASTAAVGPVEAGFVIGSVFVAADAAVVSHLDADSVIDVAAAIPAVVVVA